VIMCFRHTATGYHPTVAASPKHKGDPHLEGSNKISEVMAPGQKVFSRTTACPRFAK
jgi:hypothetical protein